MSQLFEILLKKVEDAYADVSTVLDASNTEEARTEFLLATERRSLDPMSYHTPYDLIALRHPNFRYEADRNLSLAEINEQIMELLDVIQDAAASSSTELGPTEARLVQYVARDSLLKHLLLRGVYDYRNGNDSEANANIVRECNEKLYQKPVKSVFKLLLVEKLQAIQPEKFTVPEQQIIYRDLLKQLEDVLPEGPENVNHPISYRPDPQLVKRFADLIDETFDTSPVKIPVKKTYSPKEVCDILNGLIITDFGAKTNFAAVVDDSVTNLRVMPNDRLILVPLHRAKGDYDYDTLQEIIHRHEYRTHAYRQLYAETLNAPRPLCYGLPGYSQFEEGLAKCMETTIHRDFDKVTQVWHYLTISLATFYQKDFRQVYDIIFALQYLVADLSKPNMIANLQKTAFNQTQRAFRGTGVLPSNIDLCYFNGAQKAWNYIAQNINQPEKLIDTLFRSGKIDSTDETHLAFWRYFTGKAD